MKMNHQLTLYQVHVHKFMYNYLPNVNREAESIRQIE